MAPVSVALSSNPANSSSDGPIHELHEEFEEAPLFMAAMTMLNYALLTLFGYMRDFLREHGYGASTLKHEKENQQVNCTNDGLSKG